MNDPEAPPAAVDPPLIYTKGLARAIGRAASGPPSDTGPATANQATGTTQVQALRCATCTIRRGEFVAIIGPSGSGKTTLLSLLGLLDHATSGTYRFDGVDVGSLREPDRDDLRANSIGFVFQNSYLIGAETVGANVALGLRVRGVPARERNRLVLQALDRVGLASAINRRAGNLSGGEKQRVAVARALVTSPRMILADEPTGALDSDSTVRLMELLGSVNAAGTTVVVVTHDPLVAGAARRHLSITDGVLDDAGGAPVAGVVEPGAAVPRRPQGKRSVRLRQEVADAVLASLIRPARSLLVTLAYVLGVAALVGAMGVAGGSTGQVVERLTEAGSNEIRVTDNSIPWSFDSAMAEGVDPLTAVNGLWNQSQVTAGQVAAIEGVVAATPVQVYSSGGNAISRIGPGRAGGQVYGGQGSGGRTGTVPFGGRLMILSDSYFEASGTEVSSGTTGLLGNTWDAVVVVAGSRAAAELGLTEASPGVTIWVNGLSVDVAAILSPSGDVRLDSALFFSPAARLILSDQTDQYWDIRTADGYAEPVAKAIPLALAPNNPGQIAVSTVAQLAGLQQGVSADLSRMLGAIGAVILVLSALTSATTMFLAVQHRGPEIALRRAMGASRASIWRLFTYEGTAVGTCGGVVGTAIGIGVAVLVSQANSWPVHIGSRTVAAGFLVGFLAAVLASMIPALHAARRDPAEILRTI
ncbi:MAG: ATP-binding cassette domain-containing protein [Bifidobacteriaceae bacterium]|jgi:macrolide transport system ATP-binding/permease protein|nr:ATP-binding cassette domain-containing protein [Bifidobacteriaceae bacterium]